MDQSASASHLLNLLLPQWQELPRSTAAKDDLQLDVEPAPLGELVSRWAVDDFSGRSPIGLFPEASMAGAAGAFFISTGTISFNPNWLTTDAPHQAQAMPSEELGHHFNGLPSSSGPLGVANELAAPLLHGEGGISAQLGEYPRSDSVRGGVVAAGQTQAVEPSIITRNPAPAASPGRAACGDFRNSDALAALKPECTGDTWGHTPSNGDSSSAQPERGLARDRPVQPGTTTLFNHPFTQSPRAHRIQAPASGLAGTASSTRAMGRTNSQQSASRASPSSRIQHRPPPTG